MIMKNASFLAADPDFQNLPSLHQAARKGAAHLRQELVGGVRADVLSQTGQTALFQVRHGESARLLLEKGCQWDVVDRFGQDALSFWLRPSQGWPVNAPARTNLIAVWPGFTSADQGYGWLCNNLEKGHWDGRALARALALVALPAGCREKNLALLRYVCNDAIENERMEAGGLRHDNYARRQTCVRYKLAVLIEHLGLDDPAVFGQVDPHTQVLAGLAAIVSDLDRVVPQGHRFKKHLVDQLLSMPGLLQTIDSMENERAGLLPTLSEKLMRIVWGPRAPLNRRHRRWELLSWWCRRRLELNSSHPQDENGTSLPPMLPARIRTGVARMLAQAAKQSSPPIRVHHAMALLPDSCVREAAMDYIERHMVWNDEPSLVRDRLMTWLIHEGVPPDIMGRLSACLLARPVPTPSYPVRSPRARL